MQKKLSRILIVLLLVCLVSAPFASAQYTDSIAVLGGLGAISRDALEAMLAAVACPCDGGSCTCGAGGSGAGPCTPCTTCECACEKCVFLRSHPAGSIYMTTDSASPAVTYGGIWAQWGQGKVPVGAAGGGVNPTFMDFDGVLKTFAPGETGGEYRHTLTIPEMPSHNHTVPMEAGGTFFNVGSYYGINVSTAWANRAGSYTGGDGSHNNVQPYVACYMWKRDTADTDNSCPTSNCPSCVCACGGGGGAGSCGCEPYTATFPISITDNDISIDLSGYVTTGGLTTALGDYVTSTSLTTTLAGYVTSTSLVTTLAGYVTTTGLTTALSNYYTKTEVDALTTWEPMAIDTTGLEGYAGSAPSFKLNRATRQIKIHFNGVTMNSPSIGQAICRITYPSGFGTSVTRRFLAGIDLAGGAGRLATGIDINTDGTIRIYPEIPTQMGGNVAGMQGGNLYGDAIVCIDP